jgi:hypothetical protein
MSDASPRRRCLLCGRGFDPSPRMTTRVQSFCSRACWKVWARRQLGRACRPKPAYIPPATSWWVGCDREEFRRRLAEESARQRRAIAPPVPTAPSEDGPFTRRPRRPSVDDDWRRRLLASFVDGRVSEASDEA